jgi:hypothetical protein
LGRIVLIDALPAHAAALLEALQAAFQAGPLAFQRDVLRGVAEGEAAAQAAPAKPPTHVWVRETHNDTSPPRYGKDAGAWGFLAAKGPKADWTLYDIDQCQQLERALAKHPEVIFALTHNYSGYPMIRHAKAMVKAGETAVAAGVKLVLSSRAGSGRTFRTQRGDKSGFISADNLTPQKARILLSLALTKGLDDDGIRRVFATY